MVDKGVPSTSVCAIFELDMSFKKTILEKIASYIPGYGGYKEKEVRRETDALLRRHISSILSTAAAQLVLSPTEARSVAANPEARYLWDYVKAIFDKVIQKIDKAPHGYAGFFNIVKVNEEVLDRVYSHDLALVEHARNVADYVNDVKKARATSPEWFDALNRVKAALEELDRQIDERTKILKGIQEPPEWGRR